MPRFYFFGLEGASDPSAGRVPEPNEVRKPSPTGLRTPPPLTCRPPKVVVMELPPREKVARCGADDRRDCVYDCET